MRVLAARCLPRYFCKNPIHINPTTNKPYIKGKSVQPLLHMDETLDASVADTLDYKLTWRLGYTKALKELLDRRANSTQSILDCARHINNAETYRAKEALSK